MAAIKRCRECGVPLMVSKGHTWYDNGVIVQASDPDHRMLFYESDNLNGLFQGIEEIIGVPIDKIVIESKRREVKEHVEKMLSPLARKVARKVGIGRVIDTLSKNGKAFGYGEIGLVERRRKGDDNDFVTMSVKSPHSLLFFCGEVLGAWEAIDGRDHWVSYDHVGENSYEITCRVGGHPIELQERLQFKSYPYKPGDISHERCTTCKVPLSVAEYRWDLESGTITHPGDLRRMALFGPKGMEAILYDLEAELGEAIPEAVIEAQRRHVKEVTKDMTWVGDAQRYRMMMAFRGLGDMTRMEANTNHITVTLQNACIDLMAVGMVQALFELATGRESSHHEYEIVRDGDLDITITAL